MTPASGDSYIARAHALIDLGRQADAIPLLQRAIAADPEDAYPRCILAACFLDLDRDEEACRAVENAIALDPELSLAHRLHSFALRKLHKPRLALDAAREAVRLSPFEAEALLELGEAQLENGQFKEAVQAAERVRALEPASFDGHYLLGRIALQRRRWKEAEGHCREALRINPLSWVVMNNLGVALQGQRRQKEAVEAFENAAKLNPKADVVRRNLFTQTQSYIGIGVIAILVIQGLRLGFVAHANPVVLVAGLVILFIGAALFYLMRKRQLSPTVRRFYDLERKRERLYTIGYVLFWYGGIVLLLLAGFAGMIFSDGSWVAVALIVVTVPGWWYVGPRLWRHRVRPLLEQRRTNR
ncbi:MAG: tetratricopeptide repeat protein [Candidatus Dormibacteraeota bacterium]|nr:tetratricopeptide repeat protein [Candidatus Dormibacteraeota bacterium]